MHEPEHDALSKMAEINIETFTEGQIKALRATLKTDKALVACSGGVDSTVSAILVHRAIGNNLICVFIDDNFMRLSEAEQVKTLLSAEPLSLPIRIVNERQRFTEALMGQGGSVDGLIGSISTASAASVPVSVTGTNGPEAAVVEAETEVEAEDEDFGLGPWIDEETCTACDDWMKVNPKLFVYNENKKATITDPSNGSYKDLVVAAERCPSESIHPGTPINKQEKDLNKWVARAEPFNG